LYATTTMTHQPVDFTGKVTTNHGRVSVHTEACYISLSEDEATQLSAHLLAAAIKLAAEREAQNVA